MCQRQYIDSLFFWCPFQVRSALHVGFSHLDLAESYGNEAELGSLFRSLGWDALSLDVNPADGTHKLRSEVFVSSKVWATNLDAVGAALDQTLETTGLHYLDLYMIHWPGPLRSVGLVS
jgi:glycerol 2-dehydrogenase (NADP+)